MNIRKQRLFSLISVTPGGMRWRHRLAVGVLSVIAAAVGLLYLQPRQTQARQTPSPAATTLHGAAALDHLKRDGQYDSLQAAMNQARFSVSRVAHSPLGRAAWHAPNPAAGYDAYVTATGVSIAVNDEASVSLSLHSLGYGKAWRAVVPGQVSGDKQSIHIARTGGVQEWFVNGPDGLEHGFTLSEPPGERQAGVPLRLGLQVSEGWRATLSGDASSVLLRNTDGKVVEYGKLVARDNSGRAISARLAVAAEQVVIEVDDQDASYPLTIDPLFTLQQRLLAADGAAFDYLGYAVALSGNTAVVGAPYDEVTHTDQGSVYVFVRNGTGWTLQQKLFANDGAPGDKFGSAVALDGDTALIGMPEDDEGANLEFGAAYIFVRNGTTWTQQQKLSASGGLAGALFGAAVALDGNTALIGAPQQEVPPSTDTTGAAYVFVHNGAVWTQQARLLADDRGDNDMFGFSVALDGDTALVGAPTNTVTFSTQGAAYFFMRNGTTWTQQPRLTSSQAGANDQFGHAVALSGDKALISAHLYGNDDRGKFFIFRRGATGWVQTDGTEALNPKTGAHFGTALALDGDLAVIGASLGLPELGVDQRTAYVMWVASDPVLIRELGPELGSANDGFGYAVALDGDTVLVGAYHSDAATTDQGAAYAFVLRDSQHPQQQKLTANDGAMNDQLGWSVALSGDVVAVGAPDDDIAANGDQGSVYVFTRNGANWAFQQKLLANDGASGDHFGCSVALSGDTLAVGAYGDDSSRGSVYVFTRNGTTWAQQPKLTANDGVSPDNFGWSLALSGDTLVAGAQGDDTARGSAYVFTRNGTTWTQQQKLIASDREVFDYFGYAVAVSGDVVAVGAYKDDINANTDQGAAYVFIRNGTTWTPQPKITVANGAARDGFGSALALFGDTLVVGAPTSIDQSFTNRPGSVYVFARNGTAWTQVQRLTPNDSALNDSFGAAVALGGDTLVVGGWSAVNGTPRSQGRAYIFTRLGGWLQQQKLNASVRSSDDDFGWAVALSENTVVVSARRDTLGNTLFQGSAYVFASPACPAISVSPSSLPNGVLGSVYNQNLTANSGNTGEEFQFSVARGALPPGLTLDYGAGVLSGTPTVAGTYRFTIIARGTFSRCPGSREYTLSTVVCSALTLNPVALSPAIQSTAYNQTLTATGGTGPYSFAISAGALPPGLSLSTSGLLSGTPTQPGNYPLTIKVTDANGCTGTRTYTLGVGCLALIVNPATLPNGTIGTAYNQTLIPTGGAAPYRFSVSNGTLPPGVSLSLTGVLSGTPTQAGRFDFALTVQDAGVCVAFQGFTLVINASCPVITLTPATLPNGSVGAAYSQMLTATGGTAPYSFNLTTGGLPAGLSLSDAGVLTGTPTQAGTFNFTGQANDANACTGSRVYTLSINSLTQSRATKGDFDGDGKADLAVWTGATGNWAVLKSGTNTAQNLAWGAGYAPYNDVIVPGDYDGDGKIDQAIWRGADSLWYLRRSSDGQPKTQLWGANYAPYNDVPTPGDFDGDGKTDIAVWRPTTGTWYVLRSADNSSLVETWGQTGDTPVAADYDGDGKTDLAYWRPSNGTWYIKNSSGGTQTIAWGAGYAPYFDVPVAADYDGDGKADCAIWRGQDSLWYIRKSSDGQPVLQLWGANYAPYNDVPTPGDYDGDGKADIAVWRPTTGTWFVLKSSNATNLIQQHGQSGDTPVPAHGVK